MCEHPLVCVIPIGERLESVMSIGSSKMQYINAGCEVGYCLGCNKVVKPIFGLGNIMPRLYIDMPTDDEQVARVLYKYEIDNAVEAFGYTSTW